MQNDVPPPSDNLQKLGEDLLQQCGRIQAQYAADFERLSRWEAQLAQENDRLEKEKKAMSSAHVTDHDIIQLNVCGEPMAARRRTLCQVPGSLLEAMFSGRWEGSIARDDQGHVFLEFNPVCFRALLNALVHDSLVPGSQTWRSPPVPREHQEAMVRMMDFLGMAGHIQVAFKLKSTTPAVTIMDDDRSLRKASSMPSTQWDGALSCDPLPSPRCKWEIHVSSSTKFNTNGLFFGIRSIHNGEADRPYHYLPGNSFGWTQYLVWSAGSASHLNRNLFGPGDKVSMCLDVEERTLVVAVNGGPPLPALELPMDAASRQWYLFINMHTGNFCIDVTSVTTY